MSVFWDTQQRRGGRNAPLDRARPQKKKMSRNSGPKEVSKFQKRRKEATSDEKEKRAKADRQAGSTVVHGRAQATWRRTSLAR